MRQRTPASRPARVPVALPQTSGRAGGAGRSGAVAAPGTWLRSIRFSGFTALMFVVIVMFVVIIAPGLRVYLDQRQQLAALHAAVDDRTQQNDDLTAQIARWSDPAYIKAEARDRLYYVMPGETSFLIVDDVPATATDAPGSISDTISTTQVDWLSSLFASGITAGLSTQTPAELEQSGQLTPNGAVQ